MLRYALFSALAILLVPTLKAQKIRSDNVEYQFIRLPLAPADKTIRSYSAFIHAAYEEKNRTLMAEYDEKVREAEETYKREMNEYPAQVKAAEAKYEKEMEAYSKKSTGDKIIERNILGENTKPVKQVPSKPYLQTVSKPILQTSYDYPVLAATHLKLHGFESTPAGALKVLVTLYGYDYTHPRVLSEQKDMVSVGKTTSTYKATYYHTEFSYRHPMSVKVVAPDGKELLNMTPQELNVYRMYKTPATDKMPQVNAEALVRSTEEKLLQENLQFINNLVNDRLGWAPVKRTAQLYYVKEKGDDYADLMLALNEASSGLRMLATDSAAARARLEKAVSLWNQALKESNPGDKKARIDESVTTAICFNLLEAYFALRDDAAAAMVLEKMNGLRLSSGERRDKAEWELLYTDLKKRKQSNQ
ncbi:MAG TPA: hypothetical protein VFZ78_11135 [Flavisolibacter sp.]